MGCVCPRGGGCLEDGSQAPEFERRPILPSDSCSSRVSLESRYGTCDRPRSPSAEMTAAIRATQTVAHFARTSMPEFVEETSMLDTFMRSLYEEHTLVSSSAFGAYDVDLKASGVDYLVSSANKLIEGVPGFAFALCDVSTCTVPAWRCCATASRNNCHWIILGSEI